MQYLRGVISGERVEYQIQIPNRMQSVLLAGGSGGPIIDKLSYDLHLVPPASLETLRVMEYKVTPRIRNLVLYIVDSSLDRQNIYHFRTGIFRWLTYIDDCKGSAGTGKSEARRPQRRRGAGLGSPGVISTPLRSYMIGAIFNFLPRLHIFSMRVVFPAFAFPMTRIRK